MKGGGKNLRFLANKSLHLSMCEIGLRLLFISTNEKLYTEFNEFN